MTSENKSEVLSTTFVFILLKTTKTNKKLRERLNLKQVINIIAFMIAFWDSKFA